MVGDFKGQGKQISCIFISRLLEALKEDRLDVHEEPPLESALTIL